MLRSIENRQIETDKEAFIYADSICHNAKWNLPSLFYCNSKTKKGECCFTHLIGLPIHPATHSPLDLTDYQLEFANKVINSKPQKYIINKGRQMGFTEIVLRVIQYEALVGKYAGGKIGIMAGTSADLARKNLRRLWELFREISYTVKDTHFKGHLIRLNNGTTIEAFKASEESLTGDTKYRCIFMDEAAKWRLRDDSGVFSSIMPIVQSNNSDLFVISTPKGPIKKFHEIWTGHNDFEKLEYPIHRAEGNLYSTEQIETMLSESVEDINQEYLCQFTAGRNSIFAQYDQDSDYEEIEL